MGSCGDLDIPGYPQLPYECFKQKLMTKCFKIIEKNPFWGHFWLFLPKADISLKYPAVTHNSTGTANPMQNVGKN